MNIRNHNWNCHHYLIIKNQDVGHCLKNLRKKIEEAATHQKQLSGLGEKIQNFCRKSIKEISVEDWSDREKEETLIEIFENVVHHYQGKHDRTYQSGKRKR